MINRLRAYARLISQLGTWPLLIVWWGRCVQIFIVNMAARLGHLSPAGMQVPDLPCTAPQCDFSVFWPAAQLVARGQGAWAYHPVVMQMLRIGAFYPTVQPADFYYPPPTLLAVWPLASLPFETAFWVWSAALTLLAVLVLRAARLPWAVIGLALLSPAALWNLQLGQFGSITGALLVAGLLLAERRPALAGALLALLIIKPQAALLAPVGFLARGNYRVIAAAAVAGAVLFIGTLQLLGPAAWVAYFGPGAAVARAFLQAPVAGAGGHLQFGVSVFWMARTLGAGLALSYAAQGVFGLLAAACIFAAWQMFDLPKRVALTVMLSLLATPYGYVDDMFAWSLVLLWQAQARGWKIGLDDAVFFLWPVIGPAVFTATGVELTPVVAALAAWRCWTRAAPATPETRLERANPLARDSLFAARG